MKKVILILFILLLSINGEAQGDIQTGFWRVHLPYKSAFELTETPTELIVIAEKGSFFLNKEDASIKRVSKIEGFSEVRMNKAKYDPNTKTLVIAYQNGNLDLVKDNTITNINAIVNNNTIQGVKTINHIHFNDKKAYLSTSFGLLVVDILKAEIKESYTSIGPGGSTIAINSCATLNDSIYIATNEGIFAAKLSSGVILGQFSNWHLLGDSKGANHIVAFNNKLYADPDSNFSFYDNGWQDIDGDGKDTLRSLEVNHQKLVAAEVGKIRVFNTSTLEKTLPIQLVDKAIIDQTNQVWFVVRGFGLIKKFDNGAETQLLPNGPNGSESYNMLAKGNELWVMGGGYNRGYDPLFDNVGYYRFKDGSWNNRGSHPLTDNMRDFTHPAYNKNTGEFIIATQSTGIVSFSDNNEPNLVYTEQNSSLKKNPAPPTGNGFLICNGAAFDNNNNLWVANPSNRDSSLVVRTTTGKWARIGLRARAGQVIVDNNNYKWIVTPQTNSYGIIVYDDNNTPDNLFDDRVKELTSSVGNGKLINNNVVSIALDQDGEIWIGTTQGICVIRNPRNVFEQNADFDADQLIITQGNNTDYLLGDEIINSIAVDGGNRKWIGTRRGAFHITENGDSILRRFNEGNSPMLSDLIQSIGIMPNTGEIFFGTQEGIISYRGDATESKENFNNVKVFPNPVRSGYEGSITITNLKEKTLVKITDLTGQLVSEGVSEGGTFVWDGKNLNGRSISSGVYLVLVADKDVEETNVAKILFLK